MARVFSFSLFGSADKYCKGIIRNIELIQVAFPSWKIWIHIGNDVPENIIHILSSYPSVKLILTNEVGMVNKFYRFFPIDDPNVDICCIRDADSRVLERDVGCIEDFLESDKLFHIIRDHPNHHHPILAGTISIKKGLVNNIHGLFCQYREKNDVTTFWNDQDFLKSIFYPRVLAVSMIHDDLQQFEPYSMKTPFKVPINTGLDFIGQVYEYDENGNEYPKFNDFFLGGVYGLAFWTEERRHRVGYHTK
jgi:hypothetical protein